MACKSCGGLNDVKLLRLISNTENRKPIKPPIKNNILKLVGSKTCIKCGVGLFHEFDGKLKVNVMRCPKCRQKYRF